MINKQKYQKPVAWGSGIIPLTRRTLDIGNGEFVSDSK
jgi:hypothetical protein